MSFGEVGGSMRMGLSLTSARSHVTEGGKIVRSRQTWLTE